MSDAYAQDRSLVREDSNYIDQALDTTIALTTISFFLGLVTMVDAVGLATSGGALTSFFLELLAVGVGGVAVVAALSYLNVVPITSQRVRGIGVGIVISLLGLTVLAAALPVNMATLLGLVLLIEAASVLGAGILSWQGIFDTDPSPSAGLLAGVAFGVVGLIIGAVVGGTFFPSIGLTVVFPDGTPLVIDFGYLLPALGLAGLLGAATILPREDLGTAIPVAVLVGGLGAVVVFGTIDPGWVWSPGEDIDADFTGHIVIPLFVLLGSVVSSWGTAKARAGYGAVGRQFGSYLVVYLNAGVMLTIMVAIVTFVAMKGLTYALHGFTVGALTGLVLLAPLLAVVVSWARTPAGTAEWHSGARQLFRAIPVAAVGGLAAFLASLQLRGQSFEIPFQFTVFNQSRQEVTLDTAFTITTEPRVGTLIVLISGLLLAWYFKRQYGSLQSVGDQSDRLLAVERWVGIAMGAMTLLAVVLLISPPTITVDVFVTTLSMYVDTIADTLGLAVVAGAALAAIGLLVLAGETVLSVGKPVAERARENPDRLRIGLFGAVGLLAVAALLEPLAGVRPSVGSFDILPVVATAGAALGLVIAVMTAALARTATPATERVLRKESAMALSATAAFVVVTALHVALTQVSFTLAGATIGVTGTLSWPMTMSPYIPLGLEPGGIMPAVVGTVWLVVGATLFAVPLGVGAAVFLTEYAEQGKFTGLVEIATNSLWSTPSVVFGLFGAAFLIPRLDNSESLLAAMLVLGFMLLPLVLITSREALKSVPDEYRDASAALGVSKWDTVRSVVLPAAMPGVITGVILGVGRIAGETAPLILVLGSTLNETSSVDVLGGFRFVGHPPFVDNPALLESSAALPTQVWAVISAGVSGSPSMGWGSAFILLAVVLSFYAVGIIARTYFRRKLDYE